jgi:hypothetical protein
VERWKEKKKKRVDHRGIEWNRPFRASPSGHMPGPMLFPSSGASASDGVDYLNDLLESLCHTDGDLATNDWTAESDPKRRTARWPDGRYHLKVKEQFFKEHNKKLHGIRKGKWRTCTTWDRQTDSNNENTRRLNWNKVINGRTKSRRKIKRGQRARAKSYLHVR